MTILPDFRKYFSNESFRLVLYLILTRIILLLGTYFLVGNFKEWNNLGEFLTVYGKRWDGNSYTFLAQNWYVTEGPEKFFIVFPPLYPILIKIFNIFVNNFVLSGVILSNVFFVTALFFFYRLVERITDKNYALRALLLFSVFPTSFFFSVAYPESLFVLLVVLSFFFLEKENFFLSFIFAGLATITKPFGLVLWPALLLGVFLQKKRIFRNLILMIIFFFIFYGSYLFINYKIYGDFLTFKKFLMENWFKSFAFPWQGILNSWKRGIFTPEWSSYKIFVGYGEAIASTLAWILIPVAFLRKVKLTYIIYYILGVVLFTSTGFILSAPRYLLSLPPFFIILSKIFKTKIAFSFWVIGLTILLFYLSVIFATGQWAF
jgi:hypothetical protein